MADSAFEGQVHTRQQLGTYEEERERRPLYRDPDLHLLVRASLACVSRPRLGVGVVCV
jgi:hypothetical protein